MKGKIVACIYTMFNLTLLLINARLELVKILSDQ